VGKGSEVNSEREEPQKLQLCAWGWGCVPETSVQGIESCSQGALGGGRDGTERDRAGASSSVKVVVGYRGAASLSPE
jgi:hypothetical protein